jgi:hypothetical protein
VGPRDNNSHGPDPQSFLGLLHDDYSAKQRLIARFGAPR